MPQKVITTIFLVSEGIMLADYEFKGETMIGAYYTNMLTFLQEVICQKRGEKLMQSVSLLLDNVSIHKTRTVVFVITLCDLEELNHSSYDPDPTPSEYFVSPNLKNNLSFL